MNIRNTFKIGLPIRTITWIISPLLFGYSGSVLSWCALNKSFSAVSSSQCALNIYTECRDDPLLCPSKANTLPQCNDSGIALNLANSLSNITIRGANFQPEGYAVIDGSSASLTEAYSGLALVCFGDNKQVTYKWKKPTTNSPEIIPVGGKLAYATNDSNSSDIGMIVNAIAGSGESTLFPQQSASTLNNAEIANDGQFDGVFLYDFGRILFDGLRINNTGATPQERLTSKPYAELEVSYYSSDNATSTSTVSFDVYIAKGATVAKVNTCGVSAASNRVHLGDATVQSIRNRTAPIVPFAINYECDGEITEQASVAFKPLMPTMHADTERTLIRSPYSTSEGVGVAFSKESSPFTPLKWLDLNVCNTKFDNKLGFCPSEADNAASLSAAEAGWIKVNARPGQSEQFYAQMQPIEGQEIQSGTVEAKVMAVITHK